MDRCKCGDEAVKNGTCRICLDIKRDLGRKRKKHSRNLRKVRKQIKGMPEQKKERIKRDILYCLVELSRGRV